MPIKEEIDCTLHRVGDCKAPEIGLKGCVFYPFFQMYQGQHDLNNQVTQQHVAEAIEELRKQTTAIFKILEGNGSEGIKVRLGKLEQKLMFYIALGGAAAGMATHVVIMIVQFYLKVSIGG